MGRDNGLEMKLAAFQTLEDDPLAPETRERLRAALADRQGMVVARAAGIIDRHGITGLESELAAAFRRFLRDGDKTDKGCLAKVAIVGTLYRQGGGDVELFRAGVRHKQMEPVWGGRIDTAGALRGACALALARLGWREIYFELVGLLCDPEPEARRLAIDACVWLEREEGELLLRMRILARDPEPEIVAECLGGLMRLAPERSLDFVAGWLEDERPTVREGAAMALGESRSAEAFAKLRDCWDRRVDAEFRKALALPIALCRLDESFDFLLRVAEDSHRALAGAAVEALRIHAADPARERRIREVLIRRGDEDLLSLYEQPEND